MKKNKSIVELSQKYNTDKKMDNGVKCYNGVLGHNYAKYYDQYLSKLDVNKMLEIGVSWGASIKMWDEYYDKNVEITGIDIDEKRFKVKDIETNNIKILLGNQNDIGFLNKLSNESFDLIIDDGSHRMKDQQVSLKVLFKYLRNGGLYIIEDLHTSKHESFYDSKKESTTIDVINDLKNKSNNKSNYIDDDEYDYLINNIESIEIHEKNKIVFIKKIKK
jgi:predicted O-methyltransferase YrrM